MGFLLPAALGALVLAAIPILLHLLRRRDVEERAFPALRYLPPDARRRDRTFRIRSWLLLALRVGAVAVATFGAARWILPLGSGDHPPADLVLIVDNGITSAAVVDGTRILDAQLALGREILSELGALDRVWVLGAEAPDRPLRPVSPQSALDLLEMLEPEPAEARVADAVRRAEGILAARPRSPRQVVVLRSDGSRLPDDLLAALPPDLALREVDPGVPFPANRGVTRVEIGGGLSPRAGETTELRVSVEGSDGPARDEAVRLLLGGELAGASRTDATGTARIVLPPAREGRIEGRVEIDPDALRLDDAVDFRLEVVPAPEVRVQGEPSAWLGAALAALADGGRIAPASGTGGVPPGPGDAFAAWPGVTGGGGGQRIGAGPVRILLPPSDPAGLPAFNLALASEGAPVRLGPPTDGRSWTRTLPADGLPAALGGLEVRRHFPLNPPDNLHAHVDTVPGAQAAPSTPGAARIVARLETGDPWIVEWSGDPEVSGASTLRLVALPLVPAWSGIPLSAAMIPLVDRLLQPGTLAAGTDAGPVVAHPPPAPNAVATAGPPPPGWTRSILAERRGREATPFLAWLLFVILCTEGWLAGGLRRRRSGPSLAPRDP